MSDSRIAARRLSSAAADGGPLERRVGVSQPFGSFQRGSEIEDRIQAAMDAKQRRDLPNGEQAPSAYGRALFPES